MTEGGYIPSGRVDQEGDRVVVPGRKHTLILPDAELTLPDDRFPPYRMLVAYSMWFGGEYKTLDEMIAARTKAEMKLNSDMAEWQRAIEPPCYVQYGIEDPDTKERVLIYARILDVDRFINLEKFAGGRIGPDADAFAKRLKSRMEYALGRGWLYGQWYSEKNITGDYGAVHKAVIQEVLSEAKYKELEANGWASSK